jgi:hypothetical protein
MSANRVKVIIDYDGTLTYEERYVEDLAKSALKDLGENILKVPEKQVLELYQNTKNKIIKKPDLYSWMVDNIPACYAHEGALLLNTVTTQTLINENSQFVNSVKNFFKNKDIVYDPVVDITNYLFHKHTHDLKPHFRKTAKNTLMHFIKTDGFDPYILTCSLGDKVAKNLASLGIGTNNFETGFEYRVDVFDDTRQYEMDSSWDFYFNHPKYGKVQTVPVQNGFKIDLRRPAYYKKLLEITADSGKTIIVADMVSLPGILPLLMGLDFVLAKAVYTPQWAVDFVSSWDNGWVIDDIGQLPELVDKIMNQWFLKAPLL